MANRVPGWPWPPVWLCLRTGPRSGRLRLALKIEPGVSAGSSALTPRLLMPLTAASQPKAPREFGAALTAITGHVDDYAARARLPRAAWKLDTNVQKLGGSGPG